MTPRVDGQVLVADGGLGVRRLRPAAQHGAHACREYPRAERLGHVVGGAELEAGDDVRLRPLGREHHDGDRPGLRVVLESPADVETVDARQHEVEHDKVGRPGARRGQRVLTGAHRGHAVAFLREVVGDELEDLSLVVDDQDVFVGHGQTLPPECIAAMLPTPC